HDIRTPLTLIKVPVEWANDIEEDSVVVKRNLSLLKNYTERQIELTTQLLHCRKLDLNQLKLKHAVTDVNKVMNELIADFKPAAKKSDITIRIFEPETTLTAAIDQEAFIKIVSNLLSNAIKYASQYVSIEWDAGDDLQRFAVTVANDGDLIPPAYRKKIFEPFFRIPGRNEIHGTGIGLSLARSLANLHNGELDIVADETELNIFKLMLPISQCSAIKLGQPTMQVENEGDIAHN